MRSLAEGSYKAARHTQCLMCGSRNPYSLGLRFTKDKNGVVETTFQGNLNLQGYEGILHGGVISSLLDSAMTHCLFHYEIEAVTGDLRVKFVEEVPYDSRLKLRAWVVSEVPPLYHLKSELRHNQKVVAWAEAKFMRKGAVL